MALRSLLRYALLTPLQITIFLLISLPLAIFAGVTTFLSVIFLSSRLFLVYVDLIFSVLFAAPPPPPRTTQPPAVKVRARVSPPLSIPRSPPRGGGAGANSGAEYPSSSSQQQRPSHTAPSSPNISRKRLSAGAYTAMHMSIASPPLTMKTAKGAKSSPSTPYSVAPPPPYALHSAGGSAKGGRRTVRIADADGGGGDYFSVGGRS
ncbi:hypothetical protein TWF696_006948 [Orbilia brochopaga]|uniref:Uncharacterized protein n=1 Tax=Orbilia brochopaga TaxID=3140254 RepID=A0AAV9UQB1_9PEZI